MSLLLLLLLFRGNSTLVLEPAKLAELPYASATLTVTATSWLNTSSTARLTFRKLGAGETPSIDFARGPDQSFRLHEQLKVETKLEAKSVCRGRKVGRAH